MKIFEKDRAPEVRQRPRRFDAGGAVPRANRCRRADCDEIRAEIDGQTAAIGGRLERIDPALANSYRSAVRALTGNSRVSADFGKLICETILGALKALAPDERVADWTDDPAFFTRAMTPTRSARLHYLFREIEDPMLIDCIERDVEQLLVYVAGQSAMGSTDGYALGEPAREFLRLKFEQVLASLLSGTRRRAA